MTISENQLKGIIAVCLLLAIIPFVSLVAGTLSKHRIPDRIQQCAGCMPVEIYECGRTSGVYFVLPGTEINKFLQSAGIRQKMEEDSLLQEPCRLIIDGSSAANRVTIAPMPQAKRLSLGLPMNINEVTEEDLLLIKGIGETTAEKIILLRNKVKRFNDIDQLKEINGVKDKRISEIRKYLYVDKR